MADAAALEVSGLRFRYPGTARTREDGRPRFDMIAPDMTVERGGRVLVRAASGAGKSTLMSLIAGLDSPTEGRVLVAGQDVHRLGAGERDGFRAARIGMIFQTFHLLQGFTAEENVLAALMFGSVPKREHKGRARELLTRLGIERAGAKVETLSVGQRQRVAVARAVACGPTLVLADEPTASLDEANAKAAMDVIVEACQVSGAALVCASHDGTLAARFDRVVTMEAPR